MAEKKKRGGCLLLGCGCGVVALVLLAGIGFVALRLADGNPVIAGFDLRKIDVLGMFDATSVELRPRSMQPTPDGGVEVVIDLEKLASPEWEWTNLEVSSEELLIGGSRHPAERTSPIPHPVSGVTPLAFRTGPLEAGDGEPVVLSIKVRVSAERLGGSTRVQIGNTRTLDVGTYGTWFEPAPAARPAPAAGEEEDG